MSFEQKCLVGRSLVFVYVNENYSLESQILEFMSFAEANLSALYLNPKMLICLFVFIMYLQFTI